MFWRFVGFRECKGHDKAFQCFCQKGFMKPSPLSCSLVRHFWATAGPSGVVGIDSIDLPRKAIEVLHGFRMLPLTNATLDMGKDCKLVECNINMKFNMRQIFKFASDFLRLEL